ncbi:MAG: MerR family transcriptional regulator [Mariprofundaceae bacterium]|nr:MerR family transcriptional regulator [Mariprofundaceae bacterium]
MPTQIQKTIEEKQLPIRYVAQATGVLPVTLRAWERRYGLLKPARTEKGHRLYSEGDIATIRQIVALIRRGIPIGTARGMLDQPQQKSVAASDWPAFRNQLTKASQSLDISAALQVMRHAGQLYPLTMLAETLILPVDRIMMQTGSSSAWAARNVLMSSCELYLEQRSQQAQPGTGNGPVLLAGLSQAQSFPGAQLFVACMREAGIDARWLGAMPDATAFAGVLRDSKALAGIIWEDNEPAVDWEAELRQLQRARPCFVMLGGEMPGRYPAAVQALSMPVLPRDNDESAALLLALRRKPAGIGGKP